MRMSGKKVLAIVLAAVISFGTFAALAEEDISELYSEPIVIEQQGNVSSVMAWEVYDQSGKIDNYHRSAKERIYMPAGEDYTKIRLGILTFRENAFRQNAYAGEVDAPTSLKVQWKRQLCILQENEADISDCECLRQPAIMKWSVEVREASNLYEEKRQKKALKEVIIPGKDGRIYFLELFDGSKTRDNIYDGQFTGGAPCIHPSGLPYMSLGEAADSETMGEDEYLLRQYNLYTQTQFPSAKDAEGNDLVIGNENNSLFDRKSDTLITMDSDGNLYLVYLNSNFDWREASYEIDPRTVMMKTSFAGKDKSMTAVKSPFAMVDHYVFYANMAGTVCCVDTDTLTPVWFAETGDSVFAAVALDQVEEDRLDLYTANTLNLHENGGNVQVRRLDAMNGNEIWCREIGVKKEPGGKVPSGFVASPVIGKGELGDLVFYTVTGLNAEGQGLLNVGEVSEAAIIALEKETGDVLWVKGLEGQAFFSPLALYNSEAEKGWIVQAVQDGTVLLLDGRTGETVASLALEGEICASPVAYNDMLVVDTVIHNQETVFGISIGSVEEASTVFETSNYMDYYARKDPDNKTGASPRAMQYMLEQQLGYTPNYQRSGDGKWMIFHLWENELYIPLQGQNTLDMVYLNDELINQNSLFNVFPNGREYQLSRLEGDFYKISWEREGQGQIKITAKPLIWDTPDRERILSYIRIDGDSTAQVWLSAETYRQMEYYLYGDGNKSIKWEEIEELNK